MKSWIALVHKEPGSAWGLSFPDLPGCCAAADDPADILPKAREALDLWFEDGDEETAPRDRTAVAAEVAADLAAGAFLIEVPRGT